MSTPDNNQRTFTIGDWLVEPDLLRLSRDQKQLKLEPKVMQVLVYLVQNAGQVVSRQQLEDEIWKDVVVGYDSLGSAIIKLRKAFNDDPRNPAFIQTIPKKGYRIIAPVKFQQEKLSHIETTTPIPKITTKPHAYTKWAGIIILILVIVGIWLFNNIQRSTIQPSQVRINPPRIAVLPFKNLSTEPQQEYFSDGISSDLITDLASIDNLTVISRSSAFTYKNTNFDIKNIKKELNVDYIVEGSVRKIDNMVRISAALINTDNGVSVWAERFDSEYKDVFSLQDKVVEKIVTSLQVRLTKQEQQQIAARYTNSIVAYDLFLQGWQHFWQYTKESNEQARSFYEKAIKLDSEFARAYANLAVTYAFDYMNGWSIDPEQTLQKAHVYSQQAEQINAELPQVQWALGIVHTYSRNYEAAIKAVEKATTLAPNFADGYGLLATVLNFSAKPGEAKLVMQKALTLNPRHPFIYKMIMGQILFNLHDYSDAAVWLSAAAQRNPTAQEVRLWLAATYAYLGKIEEAGWQLENIHNTGVKLSAPYLEQSIPLKDPVLRKHLIDGLIKAGLKI